SRRGWQRKSREANSPRNPPLPVPERRIHRPHAQDCQQLVLPSMHALRLAARTIIVTLHMQQTVNRIEKQLVVERVAKLFSPTRSFINAQHRVEFDGSPFPRLLDIS